MSNNEPQPLRLSFGYKFIWGIAALGTSLISGVFGALLPIFYQDYLGLAARWIALASGIYAVWNALNDPIFGYISDSTRSKHGRRIPYMRYTAPFLAMTFILVWLAPQKAGDSTLFLWMLTSMVLYDGCYTMIGLVYSALLPEVTESDNERNHLQISSSLFGLLGTLLGFLIPDFFRPKGEAIPTFFPLQIAMVVVGVTGMLLIIAVTFKVKERPEFTRVDKPLKLKEQIKFTFTSKAFLILVAQNFMSILVASMVTGSVFYLADYTLHGHKLRFFKELKTRG
jgi:GPH family glycoside/pentoside/hexuronide:cation symporter